MAHLVEGGERFTRTVAAFNEEVLEGNLVVSGAVLEKAWQEFCRTRTPLDLEAALLEYLTAEGGRFARTAAAFQEEAHCLVVSGAVMENAWEDVSSVMIEKADCIFEYIESGDLADVQLYVCVGLDLKDLMQEIVEGDDECFEEGNAPPLYWAARYDRLELVQFFVRDGHDIDKVKTDGRTSLYTAARHGLFAVMRYLVEQGAAKDKADNDGLTPFMASINGGHVGVAEYLLEQGCDIDHARSDGWTALHYAAANGKVDIVELLLRYGAQSDVRSSEGETPADVATTYGHPAVAAAIRERN